MDLQALVTDNVTELLVKIVEFTEKRQKVLIRNINHMHSAGFVPMDLPVDEFSEVLNTAIDEHIHNNRLVLCDTRNVRFSSDGELDVEPIVDDSAAALFSDDPDEYLRAQVDKLLENALNQRVAAELLRDREGFAGIS